MWYLRKLEISCEQFGPVSEYLYPGKNNSRNFSQLVAKLGHKVWIIYRLFNINVIICDAPNTKNASQLGEKQKLLCLYLGFFKHTISHEIFLKFLIYPGKNQ